MTSRLQSVLFATSITQKGTSLSSFVFLHEVVPLRVDKAQNCSAGRVAASAMGLAVSRSGVLNFMRVCFFVCLLACFLRAQVFCRNWNFYLKAKHEFQLDTVEQSATCQAWAKPKAEGASHRKEHLCLIVCSQLICSNGADWSPSNSHLLLTPI